MLLSYGPFFFDFNYPTPGGRQTQKNRRAAVLLRFSSRRKLFVQSPKDSLPVMISETIFTSMVRCMECSAQRTARDMETGSSACTSSFRAYSFSSGSCTSTALPYARADL